MQTPPDEALSGLAPEVRELMHYQGLFAINCYLRNTLGLLQAASLLVDSAEEKEMVRVLREQAVKNIEGVDMLYNVAAQRIYERVSNAAGTNGPEPIGDTAAEGGAGLQHPPDDGHARRTTRSKARTPRRRGRPGPGGGSAA